MERSPYIEQPGIELLSRDRVAHSRSVEERALARLADEHDRGGRRNARVTHDRVADNAAGVEQVEQEIPERIGADLAGDGPPPSEPGERARGVQRAAASVEGDLVDEAERSGRRHVVDGTRDHVRDEDAEADDVGHAVWDREQGSAELEVALDSERLGARGHGEGVSRVGRASSTQPWPASTRNTVKRPAGSAAGPPRRTPGLPRGGRAPVHGLRDRARWTARSQPMPRWLSSGRIGNPCHSQRTRGRSAPAARR